MDERILLFHGEGRRKTHDLLQTVIVETLWNPVLSPLPDFGILGRIDGQVVFTTDSYVVTPPFFPGGDIGRLADCGTVNDLAVWGARPLAISCSLILEEGFLLRDLLAILSSMRAAAEEAGVIAACGDAKVVEKGSGDGIFLQRFWPGNSRLGVAYRSRSDPPGDWVILSGMMGDHQIAVMVARNHLEIGANVRSDAAPLSGMLLPVVERFGDGIRFMRDPTRGGMGVTLNEIASASEKRILLDESRLPVRPAVRGVCEILGFDPLYLANEGKALLIVDKGCKDEVVKMLQGHLYGSEAATIGEVTEWKAGVFLRTAIGACARSTTRWGTSCRGSVKGGPGPLGNPSQGTAGGRGRGSYRRADAFGHRRGVDKNPLHRGKNGTAPPEQPGDAVPMFLACRRPVIR